MAKRKPFIDGFKEPTLPSPVYAVLADIRGNGEGKLVVWSPIHSQLLCYKGANRELQKQCALTNVIGILQFQDQERSSQSVIALSAENCLYLYRSFSQSFRLRIPGIFAEQEEQMVWGRFQNSLPELTTGLQALEQRLLSQTAKNFLNATTDDRKNELVKKVFSIGINEKDAISAMTVIRQDNSSLGNIVLGSQLGRLYVLDSHGHSIVHERVIGFAPFILLAYGSFTEKYFIVAICRQGFMNFFLQNDKHIPTAKIALNTDILHASLHYPDLIVTAADQSISFYTFKNANANLVSKKHLLRLSAQPISTQFLIIKEQKVVVVLLKHEIRLYYEKNLQYVMSSKQEMCNMQCGSFGREQNCVILFYEKGGFEVLILNRQFNPKQNYGSNKPALEGETSTIPFPKKTSHFLPIWNTPDPDQAHNYRLYQKNLKLLKWRLLRERVCQKHASQEQIQLNSKILGLGPVFKVLLEVENTSEEAYFEIAVMLLYQKDKISADDSFKKIGMLPPMIPVERSFQVVSKSMKNEQLVVELSWDNKIISTVVCIPNCEQFQ